MKPKRQPLSEADLNQAITDFDLADFLINHGAQQLQSAEWLLACPTCGKEKLTVNVDARAWHCWVCEGVPGLKGRGGLLDLVAILDGMSRYEAAQRIISETKFKPQSYTLDASLNPGLSRGIPPPIPIPPPEDWVPADGTLPYLAKRGILPSVARQFGLGWCRSGRYADRLIFPVWEDGVLVYYQGRAMWEESDRPWDPHYIKALNPPRLEGVEAAVSSDVLMNLDVARHYPRVAVVEGPADCVKTGPSSVCTFGKKISGLQIAKLQRAGVRGIDLCWDGPGAREPQGAWPEMLAVAPLLATLFDVRLVYLPYGDPGQRTQEEMDYWRSRGVPVNSAMRLW